MINKVFQALTPVSNGETGFETAVPILFRPYLITIKWKLANVINANFRGTKVFVLKFEKHVANKTGLFTSVAASLPLIHYH